MMATRRCSRASRVWCRDRKGSHGWHHNRSDGKSLPWNVGRDLAQNDRVVSSSSSTIRAERPPNHELQVLHTSPTERYTPYITYKHFSTFGSIPISLFIRLKCTVAKRALPPTFTCEPSEFSRALGSSEALPWNEVHLVNADAQVVRDQLRRPLNDETANIAVMRYCVGSSCVPQNPAFVGTVCSEQTDFGGRDACHLRTKRAQQIAFCTGRS